MSDRTRNASEIRIVPGAPNPPAAGARTVAPSAVQMFRSLAAQAAALAGTAAPAVPAQPDEAQAPQMDAVNPEDAGQSNPLHDTLPGQAERLEQAAPSGRESTAEHDERPAATSTRRTAATAPKAAQDNNSGSEEAALGRQIIHACATAAHGEVLAQQMAERIARFCSMSGTSDDASLEVTLPMNPSVLADTLLHLQLSSSRIALRFKTSNPRSAQLIYDNAETLRARLSDALRRRIDVEVAA